MSDFPTLVISASQTINASRPLINTYITSSKTAIDNHVSGSADNHNAAFITYSSIITGATTVASAIDTVNSRINDHVTGIAEKHAAGDITYLGVLTAATTVLSAIETGYNIFLDHTTGVSNKHNSQDINYSGSLTTSITVQSAVNSLYSLIQSINSSGSTAEVIVARDGVNGETFAQLADRLNASENMIGHVTTKTADATLILSERGFINVTNASANITITLPSSATTHIAYTIQKTFTGSQTVTVIATASQTIEGTTAGQTLMNQYDEIKVLSDGSNWNVIGGDLHLIAHKADYVSRFGSAGALVTDLNAITEAGFFCHSTNAANAAGAAAGLVKHEHYDSNFAYQEELVSGVSGKYFRVKSAGTWSAWQRKIDSFVLLWSGSTSATGNITLNSSCTYIYDAFLITSGTSASVMYYLIECPPPGELSLISSNQVLNYSTYTGVGQLQGVDSSGLYLNLAVTGGQPLRTIYGIIRGDRVWE